MPKTRHELTEILQIRVSKEGKAAIECDDCGKLSEVVDVRKVVLVRQI